MAKRGYHSKRDSRLAAAIAWDSQAKGKSAEAAAQEAIKVLRPVVEIASTTVVLTAMKNEQGRYFLQQVEKAKASGEPEPKYKSLFSNLEPEDVQLVLSEVIQDWLFEARRRVQFGEKLSKANSKAALAQKRAERLGREYEQALKEAATAAAEEAERDAAGDEDEVEAEVAQQDVDVVEHDEDSEEELEEIDELEDEGDELDTSDPDEDEAPVSAPPVKQSVPGKPKKPASK